MVQLKIILDTRRKKADGTYPIMFRVTNLKQVNYLSFGVSILSDHWDECNRCISSVHPNAKSLNISLSKKFYEIQKAILTLEDNGDFSISLLKDVLHPQQKREVIIKEIKFLEFSKKLIDQLISEQKIGNAMVYQTSVNRFMRFCGNKDIKFSEINFEILESFKCKLANEGVKVNTIGNYLRTIRAIYNKAIKVKVVDRSLYPFTEIHIKVARTAKRALSLEELRKLLNMSLPKNSKLWHARNYFFLSFYLIGISFTDLVYLQSDSIIKGRVVFKRRKTHKEYSIKVLPQTQQILDYYKRDWNNYLLPVLPNRIKADTIEAKKCIHQWIKTTNKFLKRLGDELELESALTTYVARHTWATTAKRMGYSNELIAEALGHEYGNAITNIYLDTFDKEVIDGVNKAITKQINDLN